MRARALLAPVAALAIALTAGGAAPASASPGRGGPPPGVHRTEVYYQTQYVDGRYVSPLPLVTKRTGTTDLVVGAYHVNERVGDLALNDDPPASAHYARMWRDLATMQRAGVKVIGFLGGAAPGTFTRLDQHFDAYYPEVAQEIRRHHLDGVSLDVEEPMSLAGVERVIDRLRHDFGRRFIITLAPVAPALTGGGNLSGFDYRTLEAQRGRSIDWYDVQFYCGWGSLATTADYDRLIADGPVRADRIVAGVLTDPSLCGSGYVAPSTLATTVRTLARRYRGFGGVFGFEYSTSQPGGTAEPWEWAGIVSRAQRTHR